MSRKLSKKYRKNDIKYYIAHKIKKKEVNKSLWAFFPQLFQPQVLGLFRHGHHELTFAIMTKEKAKRAINFSIEGQKRFLYGRWNYIHRAHNTKDSTLPKGVILIPIKKAKSTFL